VKFVTKHVLLITVVSAHGLSTIKAIAKTLGVHHGMFLELFHNESSLMIMAKTCGL
jgi:hypothetical protein